LLVTQVQPARQNFNKLHGQGYLYVRLFSKTDVFLLFLVPSLESKGGTAGRV